MNEKQPCITLLTDYGDESGFVGTLHLVAFGIAPRTTVIDLDHSVPAGDVRLGALRLERLARFLPTGVHVAIVDPGVGGTRRPIAIRAADQVFVGPDNGLLLWGAEFFGSIDVAVVLDKEEYFLEGRARTFDGRDIFIPVAARLVEGTRLEEVGSTIEPVTLVRLERPVVRHQPDGSLEAEVLQVDGFGNVQLSADASDAGELRLRVGERLVVERGSNEVTARYGSAYADVEVGEVVVLIDSDAQLAYSVNGGRAEELMPVELGDLVTIRRRN